MTFRELAERVRVRMAELSVLANGSSDELVALETDDTPATLEALLALIELRRTVLPLHSRWLPGERERLVAEHPIAWLVQPHERETRVSPRRFAPDPLTTELTRAAPQLAAVSTSGTTGAARIALLGRRAVLASAAASASRLGWRDDDRWLLALPVAHIGGLSVVLRCLIARRPVVMLPAQSGATSRERLVSAIQRGAPTLLSLVPAQLDLLLELGAHFELPRRVRVILVGGAAAPRRLLAETADRGWPVLTSYGMTEACSQVATQLPGTVNRGEEGVGPPLPGVRVELRDGIIHVFGPTLMSGYIGRDGHACDPELGFRTRDVGRFDAEGRLHVLGRIDDMIITGGENVHPAEVEAVLAACPQVLEACVFGVPDQRWGQVVAAALRVDPSVAPGAVIARARHDCELALAPFKRPRRYACATEFAYGRTGKLDRAATAERLRPLLRLER